MYNHSDWGAIGRFMSLKPLVFFFQFFNELSYKMTILYQSVPFSFDQGNLIFQQCRPQGYWQIYVSFQHWQTMSNFTLPTGGGGQTEKKTQ